MHEPSSHHGFTSIALGVGKKEEARSRQEKFSLSHIGLLAVGLFIRRTVGQSSGVSGSRTGSAGLRFGTAAILWRSCWSDSWRANGDRGNQDQTTCRSSCPVLESHITRERPGNQPTLSLLHGHLSSLPPPPKAGWLGCVRAGFTVVCGWKVVVARFYFYSREFLCLRKSGTCSFPGNRF